MKAILATIMILGALTATASEKAGNGILAGKAMVKVLESASASAQAKEMVRAILTGQEGDERTSVVSTEVDHALGKVFVTIFIGVDFLNDEDNGFGVVYRLDVELQRTQSGDRYEVGKIHFEGHAG